jgi:hypothetical protein
VTTKGFARLIFQVALNGVDNCIDRLLSIDFDELSSSNGKYGEPAIVGRMCVKETKRFR